MACKANPQHLRLINRLKKVEKYKDYSLCITIEIWSHSTGRNKTTVTLFSSKRSMFLFQGSTMSELERFIDKERKEAGLFQEKTRMPSNLERKILKV